MKQDDSSAVVAGIDVGGRKKGFHLVILRGRKVLCSVNSGCPEILVRQCNDLGAQIVGIDSPCRWGKPGSGRIAERALAKKRIFSFSTPTLESAQANPSGFYNWMLNGVRVYEAFAATHPLLTDSNYSGGNVCFETFPHAITCAMLGSHLASAKKKRIQRRKLLDDVGVDTNCLKSVDDLDAALCALTAVFLKQGQTKAYGDADSGYIFVPSSQCRLP